jgi:hypothetical protein
MHGKKLLLGLSHEDTALKTPQTRIFNQKQMPLSQKVKENL